MGQTGNRAIKIEKVFRCKSFEMSKLCVVRMIGAVAVDEIEDDIKDIARKIRRTNYDDCLRRSDAQRSVRPYTGLSVAH